MSKSAHRFVFARVNQEGTTSTPDGAVTQRKREDSTANDGSTGKYQVRFPKSFDLAPAVALASASGTQPHVRVNQYGDDNRKTHVDVDAYELNLGGEKRPIGWADTSFHMIAALSSGAGERELKRLGSEASDLRVVSGVVDGTNRFHAEGNHGGYSLGAGSEKGRYRIDFEEGFEETEAPVVMATIRLHEEKVRTVHVTSAEASHAMIEVRDSDGDLAHSDFHFLAIGKATPGRQTTTGRLITGAVSRDGDRLAGEGVNSKLEKGTTATYDIDFKSDYKFTDPPVVVACTEHVKDKHLRQAQVHDVTEGGFKLDVFGFESKSRNDHGYNDCAFHFIAYAPS